MDEQVWQNSEIAAQILAYDEYADIGLLDKAVKFSTHAHRDQMRASGQPYVTHPMAVAGILLEKRLDLSSIVTAILHDTIEDTAITHEDITKEFGEEIANLVEGVTKISLLDTHDKSNKQAENFRKFIMAISKDIRVLMVKIADRLHNMRTLHHIKKSEKRERIARETMEIYAPLAARIGVTSWKDELQNLAFEQLHPDAALSIRNRLQYLEKQDTDVIGKTIQALKQLLKDHDVDCKVDGRRKTSYSIWRKMQSKRCQFEQITDIIAFRLIVDDINDAYRTLGLMHQQYSMIPSRFKDYISLPKANGYRSLHTEVLGPFNHRIEIQIRTHTMHEQAEQGIAAHWQYKTGSTQPDRSIEKYPWLKEMLEILEHSGDVNEFLEHTKIDMYESQVFVFSPAGDLFILPKGATVIDFAYAVHSRVGDCCIGCKINGRIMPLRTLVGNGDQIDIQTRKARNPSPSWLGYVITGKARSAINRFIRESGRDENVRLGKGMLVQRFQEFHRNFREKSLQGVLRHFYADSYDDLYEMVGQNRITANDVLFLVYPGDKPSGNKSASQKIKASTKTPAKSNAIAIEGLTAGMAYQLAKCCHPLPGDNIVGIVTTGKGISVHTNDCKTLGNFADMPERWIDIRWNRDDEALFVGRLFVTLENRPGTLNDLTAVVGRAKGNIHNLKFARREEDFYEVLIDIEVQNSDQLEVIIATLRMSEAITLVARS